MPPPEAFQAECPVCLMVLKEPCVIDCPCGQKMCRECVERIKKEGKPCPLCNKTDFSFMRDYGLERYLKSCDVWCSKKEDGCEWRGKLGEFEQHLNRNPSPENQWNGCQFVEVECKHECGRWFQRRYIATHQDQECLERPYFCEHCNEYDSTFEEVTDIHYAECPKYPVTCPNVCRHDPFERHEIEDHLKDDCPLTKVSCPLHYAGCEVELPRKDMPEHMKDTVTHLTLLANVTLSLTKENQELKEKQRATEEKQRATEEKQRVTEEKQRVTEEKQRVRSRKSPALSTGTIMAADLGVYDCEFVVPPPAAFQAECPVCLMVLKEPCVIDCRCGQKMCRECVERIRRKESRVRCATRPILRLFVITGSRGT